jgi:hypothetical protein
MEFERPAIFKNTNFFENAEDVKEENSLPNFQKKNLATNHINKLEAKNLELASTEMTLTNTVRQAQPLKYVGVKNLKLIEDISKFIITCLYSTNFKSNKTEIFTKLIEILEFIEHSKVRRECFLEYKEEVLQSCVDKINIKFLDYIFKMLEINLNEYRRFSE